jgi:hypothetical protein
MRERRQRGDQFPQCRQQHRVARLLHHQGIGEVVDVLRGAGEMHELDLRGQGGVPRHALLDVVLDRLHVVVGRGLDRLDLLAGGGIEVRCDRVQKGRGVRLQRRNLADPRLGSKSLQPGDLDPDPCLHQTLFAEMRSQGLGVAGVAAVDGADGGER